jgi:hypothetical protein
MRNENVSFISQARRPLVLPGLQPSFEHVFDGGLMIPERRVDFWLPIFPLDLSSRSSELHVLLALLGRH